MKVHYLDIVIFVLALVGVATVTILEHFSESNSSHRPNNSGKTQNIFRKQKKVITSFEFVYIDQWWVYIVKIWTSPIFFIFIQFSGIFGGPLVWG